MAERIGIIRLPVGRLHMELTNACNFSCEFCPDSRMKRARGSMSLEMAKSILNDVKRTGVAELVLFHVMGEPTLSPYLVDLVQYATSQGLNTCLTTNGSRLDERMLDELVNAGISQIIVSLQTPDERTFRLRGARGICFEEYADKIVAVAKRFLAGTGRTRLTINFLSSPLRRLIIPIFPEVSIADRSSDLKTHLKLWYQRIVGNAPSERGNDDVLRQIGRVRTFRENTICISRTLSFHTRIMGDWSIHFDRKNVEARFGYCPGIQENFGILWNGDYTFCCTDYDGRTSTANYRSTSLVEYLADPVVQGTVKAFNRYRVVHPYCRECLGDRNLLNALVKQVGSIAYFKLFRNKEARDL